MFYHFQSEIGKAIGPSSLLYGVLRHGDMAVDLFFVMSGFVLSLTYKDGFTGRIKARDYGRFIFIRLARIYPLHILVLVAFVSIPLALVITGRPPMRGFSGPDFVLSAFLIQNWGFSNPLPWNGPAWSISAEFFFYLLFPFAAYVVNWCARDVAGLVLVPVAIGVAIVVVSMVTDNTAADVSAFGLFRCVIGCLAGMWVREVWARWTPGPYASLMLIGLAFATGVLFGLGVLSQFVAAPLAFVLLVFGLLDQKNVVSRILSNPVLLWLGKVSFPTYMIHYFVRDWLRMILLERMPFGMIIAIYVGIVIMASALLHHGVELPGRRLGRHLAAQLFDRSNHGSRSVVRGGRPITPVETFKEPGL